MVEDLTIADATGSPEASERAADLDHIREKYRCHVDECGMRSKQGKLWSDPRDVTGAPLFYSPTDLWFCRACGRLTCVAHIKEGRCVECAGGNGFPSLAVLILMIGVVLGVVLFGTVFLV
jgi:hypothetical protein